MQTIIIAGGSAPSKQLLQKLFTPDTKIIAVDSGVDCLCCYKICPNTLVGDFDSISAVALEFCKQNNVIIETHPVHKDKTDAELGLASAVALGATAIVFLGCLGGRRFDHALGSLGLLRQCLQLGIPARIQDEQQIITLHDRVTVISGRPQQVFSILAFDSVVKNLSIHGSKYEITNYDLEVGDTRTLSNEFLTKPVALDFKSGTILVVTLMN